MFLSLNVSPGFIQGAGQRVAAEWAFAEPKSARISTLRTARFRKTMMDADFFGREEQRAGEKTLRRWIPIPESGDIRFRAGRMA